MAWQPECGDEHDGEVCELYRGHDGTHCSRMGTEWPQRPEAPAQAERRLVTIADLMTPGYRAPEPPPPEPRPRYQAPASGEWD